MKRFASALVLAAAFAVPAYGFTVDLPTLTFPTPVETTQGCIAPAQIGTQGCAATE